MTSTTKTTSTLSQYFKEIIYGGIDGIVTTFAVVAGFSGAALGSDPLVQLSFAIVLLFGLANLFADAASMGLGNFLSVRSEQHRYEQVRVAEREQIRRDPEAEFRETIAILEAKGFSSSDATAIASVYRKHEEYWLDFMMTHEHEESDPRGENPLYTGLATFVSFMVFGAIPLVPFMVGGAGSASMLFIYSCIGTFVALVALGLLKWRVVGTHLASSLLEVVLVGSTAAVLAFLVGTFFKV